MGKSELEELLALQFKARNWKPKREYTFHPFRKWRFDFAWPQKKVAIEVEGGVWVSGRHTRGSGFVKDMEKYNEAAKLGWRVFRFHGGDIKDGKVIEFMEDILGRKKK